jgi:hypothetical protein
MAAPHAARGVKRAPAGPGTPSRTPRSRGSLAGPASRPSARAAVEVLRFTPLVSLPQPPSWAASWRRLTQAPFPPDAPPPQPPAGAANGYKSARTRLRTGQRGARRFFLMGLAGRAGQASAGAQPAPRANLAVKLAAAPTVGVDEWPPRDGQRNAAEGCAGPVEPAMPDCRRSAPSPCSHRSARSERREESGGSPDRLPGGASGREL